MNYKIKNLYFINFGEGVKDFYYSSSWERHLYGLDFFNRTYTETARLRAFILRYSNDNMLWMVTKGYLHYLFRTYLGK